MALSAVRFVALEKILGLRAMKKHIALASLCVWAFAFTATVLYLLAYHLAYLRLRNNMCIILGLSHQRHVSAYDYVFQILLIIVNSVLLFSLCVCMIGIFIKVYKSHKAVTSVSGTGSFHAQHRIRKLGARLTLLLFANLLSWIPIICIASLLVADAKVHDDILNC